ncbi:MAG: response regulator [Dehalococcoidia bacterium]|nr:response regulator [Dehalococcoidia bacterium]
MRHTFLVVDSQPSDLENTARQLKLVVPGAEILTAPSAEAALALLEEQRIVPSMIFVDYHLPGMSGIEMLGEVRHRRWLERAPVAMLSQPVADKVVVTSYRLGACAFLSKPARAHELREAVRDFAQAALRMSAATPVPGNPAMVRRSAAA